MLGGGIVIRSKLQYEANFLFKVGPFKSTSKKYIQGVCENNGYFVGCVKSEPLSEFC
jgi:hypothetical protein